MLIHKIYVKMQTDANAHTMYNAVITDARTHTHIRTRTRPKTNNNYTKKTLIKKLKSYQSLLREQQGMILCVYQFASSSPSSFWSNEFSRLINSFLFATYFNGMHLCGALFCIIVVQFNLVHHMNMQYRNTGATVHLYIYYAHSMHVLPHESILENK